VSGGRGDVVDHQVAGRARFGQARVVLPWLLAEANVAARGRLVAPGERFNRRMFVSRKAIFVVALLFVFAAIPAIAGPVPSKTAANQSLDSRVADLSVVREVAANQQVSAVLAANGFTQAEVEQRLAQMSPQDLHQLSQNLEQLQPAGLTRQEWIWIGIGALAALILVVALAD
jgi:hypothetical protein